MPNKFVFNLEQKPVSKWKSACNKSCISSNKELRSIEFAFFQFFYEFKSILQVCCFWEQKKRKTKLCSWAPEKIETLAIGSLAGVGTEEASGGRNPAGRRLLCSWLRPGACLRVPNSFQGPNCKVPFSFSFVFKNSKLVKSI